MTPSRPAYAAVLAQLDLLKRLRRFHPRIIGTPPLDIDLPNSDIDIACSAAELKVFLDFARREFSQQDAFTARQLEVRGKPSVVVNFTAQSWEIELFCQTLPVEQQWGVRHFDVEQRLLALLPDLRPAVVTHKQNGLKTEPAFAAALQLDGDPYEAVLQLEKLSDAQLTALGRRVLTDTQC